MKSKKWQKYMAGMMAGVMTFSILGTTLAVPVQAASYESGWNQRDSDRDMEQEQRRHDQRIQEIEAERQRQEQLQREKDRQEQERRDRYDRERAERDRYDREHYQSREERDREARERQEAHDKKVQTNRTIGAVAAGAIIGAIIAHNS